MAAPSKMLFESRPSQHIQNLSSMKEVACIFLAESDIFSTTSAAIHSKFLSIQNDRTKVLGFFLASFC
jgi:hypothetical protein